jgi:hypothetical protein
VATNRSGSLNTSQCSASVVNSRSAIWERLLGLAHVATGLWLMYLTTTAVLNFARGFDLPL